jgi:hypothetical protein
MNYPPLQIVASGDDNPVFLPIDIQYFSYLMGIGPARNLLLAGIFFLILYYPLLEGQEFAVI